MKHYKIVRFGILVANAAHIYSARLHSGKETGEYVSPTLENDIRIESDFICQQNSFIDAIQNMDILSRPVFSRGQNTNRGIITSIVLKKSRGRIQTDNDTWYDINEITYPVVSQPVVPQAVKPNINNKQENMAVKTLSKSAPKAAVASKSAPSRSQIKNSFEKLQEQIEKETPIRLEKFLKKNLPSTVEEFVLTFFKVYSNERRTIYVNTKTVQTEAGRRRSLGDIYLICKYYYPETTLKVIVDLLFLKLPKTLSGFRSSYCSIIHKRVFYYSANNRNLMEDEIADEYGHRVLFYKS